MITVVLDVKWFDMKKALSNNMKCEVCKDTGAVIVSGGKSIRLTQEHNGIFVPLMEINSNFFETVECVFSHGWKAETMSGKKMNNIDLSDAHLTNITDLELDVGVNNTNAGLYLKMQCVGCKNLQTKMITAIPDIKWLDMKKAPSNNTKCEVCKRTGAVIVSGGIRLTQEHNGIFVPLMEINSNFFELVECVFSHGWKAETMSGKKMNNIDLSVGEFYDYDVECQCSISATNFKVMFEVMDAKVEGSSAGKHHLRKK
ncbi:hypothetical protein POM88_002148 [Heracleum sosnowskyi]|uniref:Uncharacterized protein n=1 Tax=Heracleum sosnowskyi TaxID=360622 RepID=A0AAD8NCB1_9APIA|nr:hypothetical protein POM88_002148 [Heracleum sosnowskyi]